jgi:hypothetical protein
MDMLRVGLDDNGKLPKWRGDIGPAHRRLRDPRPGGHVGQSIPRMWRQLGHVHQSEALPDGRESLAWLIAHDPPSSFIAIALIGDPLAPVVATGPVATHVSGAGAAFALNASPRL